MFLNNFHIRDIICHMLCMTNSFFLIHDDLFFHSVYNVCHQDKMFNFCVVEYVYLFLLGSGLLLLLSVSLTLDIYYYFY